MSAEPELAKVYELFVDYVLKNPFYDLEQPVNCALFDQQLELLAAQINRGS